MKNAISGLGNAIIDIQADVDDEVLSRLGLTKGTMTLCDMNLSETLLKELKSIGSDMHYSAGGSAANTIAGVQALNARNEVEGMTAFFGRVGDDELGHMFIDETLRTGTVMNPQISLDTEGRPTSRSIILVTPDGERTMLTALGASAHLEPGNVDAEILSAAEHRVFFEAYVLDTLSGRHTAEKVLIEKSARAFVTLSDPPAL